MGRAGACPCRSFPTRDQGSDSNARRWAGTAASGAMGSRSTAIHTASDAKRALARFYDVIRRFGLEGQAEDDLEVAGAATTEEGVADADIGGSDERQEADAAAGDGVDALRARVH